MAEKEVGEAPAGSVGRKGVWYIEIFVVKKKKRQEVIKISSKDNTGL